MQLIDRLSCESLFLSNLICNIYGYIVICSYAMKLTVTRSKNSATYYVQKSYRTDTGKCSTKTVERLGTLEELKARFGEAAPVV